MSKDKTQTQNQQTVENGQTTDNNRPFKPSRKQRIHDAEEAAKGAGRKAASGIKKGAGFVGRGVREGVIDVASLGLSAVVGSAVSTAANDLFITGASAANSAYNAAFDKGVINVKGRFGGWKQMSLSDYTVAVEAGKKFKDVRPDFFINRHADAFNTAGAVIGGVAGTAAGTGTFVVSRNTLKSVTMTKGEKIKAAEEMNRQVWAQVLDEKKSSNTSVYDDEEEE